MSEHTTMICELDDQEALVQSLEEMGNKVEVHENNGATIQGYGGRSWGSAQVIVRKKADLYADIGFEKMPDGTYKMHIDSGDKRKLDQKKLTQLHAKNKIQNIIKKNPGKYKLAKAETDKTGAIKLKLRVRTN